MFCSFAYTYFELWQQKLRLMGMKKARLKTPEEMDHMVKLSLELLVDRDELSFTFRG